MNDNEPNDVENCFEGKTRKNNVVNFQHICSISDD